MEFFFKKIFNLLLTLSFIFIILTFILLGIFNGLGIHDLGKISKEIYDHPLVVSNASLLAALEITKLHRNMKDVVLHESYDELDLHFLLIEENEKKVYIQLNRVRDSILGDEGKAIEKEARKLFNDWKPIRQDVIKHLELNQIQQAVLITKTNGAVHVSKLESKMLELTSYARNKADQFITIAEQQQARLEFYSIFLTYAGVFISIAIAVFATMMVHKKEKLLKDKNKILQTALDEIKTLQDILPICSYCKNIRNDDGYYEKLEEYLHKNSGVDFSHTICPDCLEKYFPKKK